jgi:DNA invertase Pin-like site-specific DNA recombinase
MAYLRVSGKEQVEGDGFTRQLKAIRICCSARLRVVNVYREKGVSGTKDFGRPAGVVGTEDSASWKRRSPWSG